MSKYNKKFEKDIELFINKTHLNMKRVRVLAVYQLFQNIVEDTPLYVEGYPKRGQTKWNWVISIGQPNLRFLKGTDVSGKKTLERGYSQLMTVVGYEDIYISNSVPWIMMLEKGGYPSPSKSGRTVGGFSTQAPNGIGKINVMQWNTIVPMVAKQVNR